MLARRRKKAGDAAKVSKSELDLLRGLLKFDSSKRWSAKTALESSYFRSMKTRTEDIAKAESVGVYSDWGGDKAINNKDGMDGEDVVKIVQEEENVKEERATA